MYRLYIDETGNADEGASEDPNHRYLSLTGAIIHNDHVREFLTPRFNQLKRTYLSDDPDARTILHRKDIMRRKYPFHVLKHNNTGDQFDEDLLSIIIGCDFTALTAVIDKLEHLRRYTVWRYDPYHYCLAVLIERYCMSLNRRGLVGDVMAEVRGGKPDRRLERSFERIYKHGTDQISAQDVQRALTSRKLKLRQKTSNISGLQLADLLAHPSAHYLRSQHVGNVTPTGFGKIISDMLVATKYDRSPNGTIIGWGTKWL